MKLIINNLVIVILTTVILQLCVLNVCANAYREYSKYGSYDVQSYEKSKMYAYSSPLTNESPEYNRKNNQENIENFEIYCDETRTKLIGGGHLIKIKENQQCKNKYTGLRQHRRNKQYYYICQQNRIVLARCEKLEIFNDTYKYCVPKKKINSNVIVYDDLKHKYNVSRCIASGAFPIDGKRRYYYTCVYLGGGFIQKICKCPRGTIFHKATGTCIERLKSVAPLITHSKIINSVEQYKLTTLKIQPNKNESSYESQPCDKPESYTSEDSLGYYYKCCLKSNGNYYQVKLKCPQGKSFDSSSEECVANSNWDYFTDFPEHSIKHIIRNKKRNLLKHLPRLLTAHQRRAAKRIELFNIFDDSNDTEEDTVDPIANKQFCGCSNVNKFIENAKESAGFKIQNTSENEKYDDVTQIKLKEIKPKSEYKSGYANIETQDESYESCIEDISKDNSSLTTQVNTTATTTVLDLSPISIDEHFLTIEGSNSSGEMTLTEQVPFLNDNRNRTLTSASLNAMAKSIIPAETVTNDTESTNAVTKVVAALLKNGPTTDLKNIYLEQLDTSIVLPDSNIHQSTLREDMSTSVLKLTSSELPYTTILTSITNSSLSTEQPNVTTVSKILLDSGKPEAHTTENQLTSLMPTSTSDKITTNLNFMTQENQDIFTDLSKQPGIIRLTTSSIESSITHSTTLAAEPILVTPPTVSINTLTTTAALIDSNTNKATTENDLPISMSTLTTSQPLNTNMLPTTPSSSTTAIDNTSKQPFPDEIYWTTTTSTTDIQTVINNTSTSSSIINTSSISIERKTLSNISTTKPIGIAGISSEILAISEINTSENIERDNANSKEINSSENESDKDIYNFADLDSPIEYTNSPFIDNIYNISNSYTMTTTLTTAKEEASGVTSESDKIGTISTKKLTIPEITTSEDIENYTENHIPGNEYSKKKYKNDNNTMEIYSESDNDRNVTVNFANSEITKETTNSQNDDIDSTNSIMISTSIDVRSEATLNVSTTKSNRLTTISTENLLIPEITTSEDIEKDIQNYSESYISENNSNTNKDDGHQEQNATEIYNDKNTSDTSQTSDVTIGQETTSPISITKNKGFASMSTEKLKLPDITTSEDIERDIQAYTEITDSVKEIVKDNTNFADSDTTIESTYYVMDNINSSSSTVIITTSKTTEKESTSTVGTSKHNKISTISTEKLTIPEITTSENIEKYIDNYNESHKSKSEFDSETSLKSTDTSFKNYNIDNAFDIKDDNENHSDNDKNIDTNNERSHDIGRDLMEGTNIGKNIYDSNKQIGKPIANDNTLPNKKNNESNILLNIDDNLSNFDQKTNYTNKHDLDNDKITTPRSLTFVKPIHNPNIEFILGEYSEELGRTSKATISDNKNKSYSTESTKHKHLPEITESEIIGNIAIEGESYNNSEIKLTRDHNDFGKQTKQNVFTETDSPSWLLFDNQARNFNTNNLQIQAKTNNETSHDKLKNRHSDERKSKNDTKTSNIAKTKSNLTRSNDKDVNNLRISANNQSSFKRYRKPKIIQFNNKIEYSKSNEVVVTKSNNDGHVTDKIDTQPLLATLNDEGFYEFEHYNNNNNNNNDKDDNFSSATTTCECEIKSHEDQFDWDSNSKEGDACCCGCITNDTSGSGRTNITV